MPTSEVWLLHGTTGKGGSKMAGKCKRYGTVWDPVSGTYARKCVSRSRSTGGLSGLGSIGRFGQASGLKGTLSSVKGVIITGAIAAGGALVTERVYEKIGPTLKLDGWKADLAEMATGIALGLLIGKFLKRPKLAAAFAIGPVVHGGIKMLSRVLAQTSGLGYTAFEPVSSYTSMYGPLYGANQLGATTEYSALPNAGYRQRAQPLRTRRAVASSVPVL